MSSAPLYQEILSSKFFKDNVGAGVETEELLGTRQGSLTLQSQRWRSLFTPQGRRGSDKVIATLKLNTSAFIPL